MPRSEGPKLDVEPKLLKAAELAWSKYKQACCGGTPEQRQSACDAAVAAENRVMQAEYALGKLLVRAR